MTQIESLFERMDLWRHLPNYQLERRVDLLFSLYLRKVLATKTGMDIAEVFVPEFPVRIGTIYPDVPIDKSYKIDYLAVAQSGEMAYFVELKTESASRRESQDEYLLASKTVGLTSMLEGLLMIFRATLAKKKYFCLLRQLEQMGLIEIPESLEKIMQGTSLQGADEASKAIKITSRVSQCEIIYIQPAGSGSGVISFEDFAAVIEEEDDPLANRFAQSLREWARVRAGFLIPKKID